MELKYGSGNIDIDLGHFNSAINLQQKPYHAKVDIIKELKPCLESLKRIIFQKKIENISIILEDKTRLNPEYPHVLSALIDVFNNAPNNNLYLVPAYGTHKPHTMNEHEKLYGKENLKHLEIIEHDSRDKSQLTQVGIFNSGSPFRINSTVAKSDLIIVIGSIAPHAFAGFTGGRKAILPGVAEYDAIKNNHSYVTSDKATLGVLDNNPIHQNMTEAAKMINVDLSIQLVRDSNKNLAGVFTGGIEEAFEAASAFCRKINSLSLSEYADVVLVSSGGHPKDDSLYQGQRAIAVASKIVKPNGIVIVFGEFGKGIGNKVFEKWLSFPRSKVLSLNREDIDIGIHSIYIFVRNSLDVNLHFYTSLSDSLCSDIQIKKISNLENVSNFLENNYSKDSVIYVIPDSSNIFFDIKK